MGITRLQEGRRAIGSFAKPEKFDLGQLFLYSRCAEQKKSIKDT